MTGCIVWFQLVFSKLLFLYFVPIWVPMAGLWSVIISNCGSGPGICPNICMLCLAANKPRNINKTKKNQCQVSEALSLLPVLVHLVKSFLVPHNLLCPKLCTAFLACAAIVDLVHLGQVWNVCSPAALQEAAESCLAAWVDANLGSFMIKKFHWTLHLGPALARFGKLPQRFAMKRKHRFICRFASSICNTLVVRKHCFKNA